MTQNIYPKGRREKNMWEDGVESTMLVASQIQLVLRVNVRFSTM